MVPMPIGKQQTALIMTKHRDGLSNPSREFARSTKGAGSLARGSASGALGTCASYFSASTAS